MEYGQCRMNIITEKNARPPRGMRHEYIHLIETKTSLVVKAKNPLIGKLGKSCSTHEPHVLSCVLFVLFVSRVLF
ncbi:hypothetical protein Y032_0018g3728 [Ancylostoma ceylanicum]|uniref:Uncharacterized protein n=1 Tax=Ancylostoma ceylanicum TaxID=53326 RepID=A0A016V4F2_9BILA|nr:hypothetical protein Y032_0018g3728 [Ancylostoma ceylanicum]